MKAKDHVSIILPVFNEEKNIQKAIESITQHVAPTHSILVIYDFATDTTIPVVEKLRKKNKTVILRKNKYGKGVANAVKTGFKIADGNYVVVMASDLADDPKTINDMYNKALEGYDIVSATRYTKGGKRLEQTSIKSLLSQTAGLLSPLLLGIPTTDLTNGFKLYKKKVIETIDITSTGGWDFTMEIIIKAFYKGYKITEVPTISRKRKFGRSKFKLVRWLPKYIFWYAYGIKQRLNRKS